MGKLIDFNNTKKIDNRNDIDDKAKEFLDFVANEFEDDIFSTVFALGFSNAIRFIFEDDLENVKNEVSKDIKDLYKIIEDFVSESENI